jgi:hypothetical protein
MVGRDARAAAALEEQAVRHAGVEQLIAERGQCRLGGVAVREVPDAGHHVDDRLGSKPGHRGGPGIVGAAVSAGSDGYAVPATPIR